MKPSTYDSIQALFLQPSCEQAILPRLLRDKSLTFVRISDMFYFSLPAYFSRYVQQHLGVSPTEYRG